MNELRPRQIKRPPARNRWVEMEPRRSQIVFSTQPPLMGSFPPPWVPESNYLKAIHDVEGHRTMRLRGAIKRGIYIQAGAFQTRDGRVVQHINENLVPYWRMQFWMKHGA